MSKSSRKLTISGSQQPDIDVLAMARVIVRLARERQAEQAATKTNLTAGPGQHS
jgi:hypothetical protein